MHNTNSIYFSVACIYCFVGFFALFIISSTLSFMSEAASGVINTHVSFISSITKFSDSPSFSTTSLTLGSVLRKYPFVAFTIQGSSAESDDDSIGFTPCQ
jgi:hypothetical protein